MTHIAIGAFVPLLAADAWSTIIGLLIFIFWSALQWLSSRNEAQQQQKPRRPRPPQPLAGAEGPMERQLPPRPLPPGKLPQGQIPQPPRNQEDALRSEVEAFLRRAQGQPAEKKPGSPERQQQPDGPQSQQHEEIRTLVSKPQQREPTLRPGWSQQASPEGQNRRQEGVAEHVAKHLSTEKIAAHTRALGETVGLADERLESRLHKKFDHDLGNLKLRGTSAEAKPPASGAAATDLATEIANMLREPAGMRKLIVANEILRRPEW